MKQIFFSKICVPQLLAPLHLIFCAASLCQDNSSESSLIMRDEVVEHMAWDLRPFLHTISLQILQIRGRRLWTLLFSSSQISYGVQAMAKPVKHFCVDLEVCFGSLSCWKVQPRPILSLLAKRLLGFHFIAAGI